MTLECKGCSEKYEIGPYASKHIKDSFIKNSIPYYIIGWCGKISRRVEQYILESPIIYNEDKHWR